MKSLFARLMTLLAVVAAVSTTHAQGPAGYRAQQPMPQMPASPLAGGRPAMQGGALMDVRGNSVVVPAQYTQQAAYVDGGGYCPPAAYGDGMFADFGGYGSPDQCGPHFFDVSAAAVFLASEDQFENVGPLTSVGVGANAPRVLNPANGGGDLEPGFEVIGRIDIGPLSVFEAAYMGMYDIGFDQSVNSLAVTDPPTDFQLFSVFSNFGLGTLVPGLDDGSVHSIVSNSELQSTELTYRRYWVGANPRITGTYLAGFRWLRFTDELALNSTGLVNGVAPGSVQRIWDGENDLLGAQIGMDISVCMRQGLRWNTETKVGLFNNHYKFRNAGDFVDGALGSPADFDVTSTGDQVAFATELKTELVFDILPSWSLRTGYRVLYLNSLATAGGNINAANISNTIVATQADALFHGVHGGFEFVW